MLGGVNFIVGWGEKVGLQSLSGEERKVKRGTVQCFPFFGFGVDCSFAMVGLLQTIIDKICFLALTDLDNPEGDRRNLAGGPLCS